jgi:hypothetical protein
LLVWWPCFATMASPSEAAMRTAKTMVATGVPQSPGRCRSKHSQQMPRQAELRTNQENIQRYSAGMLNRVNVTSFTTGSIATMAINGIPSPMKSLNISIPSQCAIAEHDRKWAKQQS